MSTILFVSYCHLFCVERVICVNKLFGFYQLRKLGIPSVPWQEFTAETKLDPNQLWTIRSAVLQNNDFNLPRAVGVTAAEAELKAKQLKKEYDLVIYYPYFVAEKSGVISATDEQIVIEACYADLWNLVTANKVDARVEIKKDRCCITGDEGLLTEEEIKELAKYTWRARQKMQAYREIILEWSYAFSSDLAKQPIGERYLVFYECRGIN